MHFTFNDFDDLQNPLLAAGQAYATYEIGKRLVAKGHQVTVLCSRYPGAQDRIQEGIKYQHLGLGSSHIKLNNLVYPFCLPFQVRHHQTDVFIDCFTAPASALCTPLFTRHPVVGLPTSFEAEEFDHKYHLPFSWIEKYGVRTYRYFMPYTQHYADKMARLNPKIQQSIIPEGVGNHFFELKKQTPEHLLFLGRLDIHQKGIDLLLQAWSQIYQQSPLPLVIAGNGPDESQVKNLVQQLGLGSSVKVVGPAYGQAKDTLLCKSLAVAFPSRHEGFSLFSLEALASGNALIGFDIPGLSWANNQSVKKSPAYDVTAYAQQLLFLITRPAKAEQLGVAAREYARHFTWDSVVEQWLQFIYPIVKKEHHD